MEDVKPVPVVSRMTKYCKVAVHYGVSLAKRYGAKLSVIHVIHDPFGIERRNIPLPNLEKDYRRLLKKERQELDEIIANENRSGMQIDVIVRKSDPTTERL